MEKGRVVVELRDVAIYHTDGDSKRAKSAEYA